MPSALNKSKMDMEYNVTNMDNNKYKYKQQNHDTDVTII